MDSISKTLKAVEEEDRISNLPSCVISHILSFLPTKDAVQTSVLSTKWKHLWTFISTLDFDDDRETFGFVKESFINFVSQVLTLHVSDLQKFRLRCNRSLQLHRTIDDSHLNSWVVAASSRNIRELDISFCMDHNLLPFEIFTCTTLVSLKLRGFFALDVPTLVHLHNLKILCLDCVQFLDNESVKSLFSSCPLLEELSIIECMFEDITVFNISAPALKSLFIDCKNEDMWSNDCKIVLNTPNLQNFNYDDYVAEDYSLNNLNSLVKVKINLISYMPETSSLVQDQSVTELAVEKFVEGISKVQWLYLSRASVETLQLCSFRLPKFPHLIYLELNEKWIGLQMLLDFLESSPQLETLIFEGLLQDEHVENQTCCWYTPENVPSCLLFHLKVIRIRHFRGNKDEMQMAKYFLKNSKVLKKLVIPTFSKELQVCTNLLMSPRGSKTCRVKLLPLFRPVF